MTCFVRSCDKIKHYTSINTMSMAINLGSVGIYNEEFPFIKSPNTLITWSCKVMQIILAALSLLPQALWPQTWQNDDLQ